MGNGRVELHEPLPLRGNRDGRVERATLGEADNAYDVFVDDARRIEADIGVRPQLEWANELESGETAPLAHALGGLLEALAERACKGFVRTVARLQCEREDVTRAGRECLRCCRQATCAYVLHD